ncbi:MAG: SMC-Scp complex subunit ScpB [Candidatus Zixiibacteriota bacterium]
MDNNNHIAVVEALILASPEPIPAKRIIESGADLTPATVANAVMELNARYEAAGSSFRIREIAGGYQYFILPDFTKYVDELFTRRRKMSLTRAALETLAIVAYRQPVTKVEIVHIRGVESDGVLHNLLEKNLVVIKGRSESVGRPLQYATTDEFLKFFGLNSLEELPEMSEIEELLKASRGDSLAVNNLDDGMDETNGFETGKEGVETSDSPDRNVDSQGNDAARITLVKEEEPEEP